MDVVTSGQILDVFAGRTMGVGPVMSHKVPVQKDPMLVSCSAVAILKCLITFGRGTPFVFCTGPYKL